uniref:Extended synaptotagmin-like protein 1a n=1 Tax=Electrophorus electricus TaxID=8005 RepID=A0A4W4HLP7_ELEEL
MSSGDAGPSVGGGLDAADSAMPEDLQPRGTTGKRFITALLSFAKCLGALLPVYLAGYFGLSISLVLFGLAVYMGWKHHRDAKQTRLHSAMYLMENEKGYTTTQVFRSKRDLPAWVNFPDVEKVEWLNKILQQAWPFVGQYLEKLLVETVAPSIRASSAHLQTFSFTKVNLGDKPMKVVGVKAHTEHDKRQVLLDIYISYAGDVEINVDVKKYFCRAGVKGIQLHGKMRVILEPLIGDVPLVGAITMFFIRRPKLDINWTGLTNLLDIPGLSTMSDTMVMDAISSFLVLPNRLTVPLVADLHVAQLRSPLPRGIVRIHLLEAENLAAKDNYIKGVIAGKSDPYALLRVGTQVFTSHHVDNNLNPQWREMYEVIVHEVPGQELEVEVFDKDPDQDDFLGRYSHILLLAVAVTTWFTLKDAPTGKVHLRLEWLSLLSSAERLSEVLQKNQNLTVSSKTTYLPSAAILTVYLDRAQDLPMKKGNKVPSPMVQLSIQDATKESKTVYGTSNPVWEDAFTFFIHDPRKQDLDIQVKDDDRSLTLGTLSIPLSRLLSVADLSMDQWFQLDKSGPAKGVIPDLTTGGTCILPTPTLPEHTSPDSSFAIEGVLRIHLVEAHDLVAKDSFMGGMMKGKSDPYMKIQVGGLTFKSHVIKENLNPVWNELYEVFHSWGQPLGSVVLPVKDIMAEQALVLDRWLTLDGALPESQLLIRAELKVTEEHTHTEVLSCMHLNGLDPYVSFILQPDKNRSTKRKTNVKKRDLNPEFNERFYFDFSLEDAMQRHLDLSVKNSVSFLSRERELIGKVLYVYWGFYPQHDQMCFWQAVCKTQHISAESQQGK